MGGKLRHTSGFLSSRAGHFDKHVLKVTKRSWARCELPTAKLYEFAADSFAGRAKHPQLHEDVINSAKRPQKNGRIVRYDERTEEFLVVDPVTRGIYTYFIPRPLSENNRFKTNLEYFNDVLKF